ncbi:flagellar biosynthesis anti-sigma factor FlgM, partial [candidate division FCPU426 bacterium]|nr:flagellar biosynthesis anti-sigma factor FlgM [candidate division FCPU426 bacterium]
GVRQEVRLTMLHYDKEKKLIQHLIKMCKKANIFRKNRVEEIQQQIKSNTYKVTGEDVAKKWFHEDAE